MALCYPQFCALRNEQQVAYLQAHGIHLAFRFSGNYSVNLYYLDSFFCETWQCLTRGEQRLRPFTGAGQLDPYALLVQ